jgi:hypothetical protein
MPSGCHLTLRIGAFSLEMWMKSTTFVSRDVIDSTRLV